MQETEQQLYQFTSILLKENCSASRKKYASYLRDGHEPSFLFKSSFN